MLDRDKKASDIIARLASNEESIERLYRGYAHALPAQGEFWMSLAGEELQHARWIRELGAGMATTPGMIDESRFNTVAIESFMNYLHNELSRLKSQKIPLIEALSITFHIEQSLIESKFFDVFESDCQEVKHVLTKIREETTAHRRKVKEALDRLIKTGSL